jgi:hypothetical protein
MFNSVFNGKNKIKITLYLFFPVIKMFTEMPSLYTTSSLQRVIHIAINTQFMVDEVSLSRV